MQLLYFGGLVSICSFCQSFLDNTFLTFFIAMQDPRPEYKLFGTIVHSGFSPESGHYYAYIKVSIYISCFLIILKKISDKLFAYHRISVFLYRMQWVGGIAAMILLSHFQLCQRYCQKKFTFFSSLVPTKGKNLPPLILATFPMG